MNRGYCPLADFRPCTTQCAWHDGDDCLVVGMVGLQECLDDRLFKLNNTLDQICSELEEIKNKLD